MKHAIGGFALGFFLGLCFIHSGPDKPMGSLLFGVLMSAVCWGLVP